MSNRGITRVLVKNSRRFSPWTLYLRISAFNTRFQSPIPLKPSLFRQFCVSSKSNSTSSLRLFHTSAGGGGSSKVKEEKGGSTHQFTETEVEDSAEEWEEEEDVEPEIGDGGDGGGVVLQNLSWGERALSLAHEVLSQFGDDMKLYAFKTTPRGYVYVRLDKIPNDYGCPSMTELESYSQSYKKLLDEAGERGEIPDDLALEVSSPGAERILKVPDDLSRFKVRPMRVSYREDVVKSNSLEKQGVFLLESIDTETQMCVWKLADVKENRDPERKGRPMSRKQKDQRIQLGYDVHTMVTLYLDC